MNAVESLLLKIFSQYSVKNLVGVSAVDFQEYLEGKIGEIDSAIEGYSDNELERQRDLSIKFHWGHNHDFQSFALQGRMGNRHIELLSDFITAFNIDINSWEDKKVLDIGCWTGGTTLLLSALCKEVFAVEEVVKYARMTQYLIKSFGIESKASVYQGSLYSLKDQSSNPLFDIVYFPGVIYHLSDPILALRILYNCLSINGEIFVESAGLPSEEPICKFEGNYKYHNDGSSREELNRGGWNYFLISPSALTLMLQEVGFEDVIAYWDEKRKRVFAYGKKNKKIGMCKAGLSDPTIS